MATRDARLGEDTTMAKKWSEISREEREQRIGWVNAEQNGPFLAAVAKVIVEQGVGWVRAFAIVREQEERGGGAQ